MDAPQGRYRVIEKDGRLIVIDNGTGRPASTSAIPPPSGRPGLSASPVAPATSNLDSFADFLLRKVVREWDKEGRAVIHWNWKKNGKEQRWDALLDRGQQRRLGRALVALSTTFPLMIFLFIAGGVFFWFGAILALMPVVWAIAAIARLQRETGGVAGG